MSSAIRPPTGGQEDLAVRLRGSLRPIADFPKPGILFQDVTPVFADGELFADVVAALARPFVELRPSHVLAPEARGFILGAAVAVSLGAGFVPARKPGKLPGAFSRIDYELEYGTDALEAHVGAWKATARVLVLDDVLATGGTARAAARLAENLGGLVIGFAFLLEIAGLDGRARLGSSVPCHTLLAC